MNKAINELTRAIEMAQRAVNALQTGGADNVLIAMAAAGIARESSLDAVITLKRESNNAH